MKGSMRPNATNRGGQHHTRFRCIAAASTLPSSSILFVIYSRGPLQDQEWLRLDRHPPALAQAVEHRNGRQARLDQFSLIDRWFSRNHPGDEGGEVGLVALVLAGARALAARPAVRGHAQGEEIVDGDDGAAGEELEALLAEGGVAERGVDDGGEAAIGEMEGRGEVVADSCRHRAGPGLDRDDVGVDQEAGEVDEMAEFAEDAPAALRGIID